MALLNELEDAGLIVRSRDRADRRRGIIELSTEGERLLLEVDRALEAVDDEILSALSADERATLNDLLARAGGSGPLVCDNEAEPVCETDDDCDSPAC